MRLTDTPPGPGPARRTTELLLAIPLVLIAMSAAASPDLDNGRALFQACAVCHGEKGEGNPTIGAPANAGQEAWYTIAQMQAFKSGERGDDFRDKYGEKMRLMALSLSDEGIRDVAAYTESLASITPEVTLGGDPERGKALFQPCQACHGEDAGGRRETSAPSLVNQYDWYIVRQLENFRDGMRGRHSENPDSPMTVMVGLLADQQDMLDVAAYLSTLR